MDVSSADALQAARAMMARDQLDALSQLDVGSAAERVTRRLGRVLVPWIGAAGHGALLERAFDTAAKQHSQLLCLRVENGRIIDDAAHAPQAASGSVVDAMVALLGSYIDLLGRVVGTEMARRLAEQAFAPAEGGIPSAGPATATRKGE